MSDTVMSITQASTATITPDDILVNQIDAQLKMSAEAIRRAYAFIRRAVYENYNYPKKNADGSIVTDTNGRPVTDSDAIYAIFEAKTRTGMKIADLKDVAQISKASFNRKELKNPIVDDCPEALIVCGVDARVLTAEDLAAIQAFAIARMNARLGIDDATEVN